MKKECLSLPERSKAPVAFGVLAALSAVWLFVFVVVYDKQIQPVMFFPDNLATNYTSRILLIYGGLSPIVCGLRAH